MGIDNAVVVTAVLPAYRAAFLELLAQEADMTVEWYAGAEHCDPTVKTGVAEPLFFKVRNYFLFGRRVFLQWGGFLPALRAHVAVVDLNPRSLTAWYILTARHLLGRRTIVWGHINPRAGSESRTRSLRAFMRSLSSATITYTWDDRRLAQATGSIHVWAATNALYSRGQLSSVGFWPAGRNVVYVGRLEAAKKPGLLVTAFAEALPDISSESRLVLVGEGAERTGLASQVAALGIAHRVDFLGPLYEFTELARLYRSAAVMVSPGYVGLTLTQSLGFGVPALLPIGERHAPEIELAHDEPLVTWFDRDSVHSLAAGIAARLRHPPSAHEREAAATRIASTYSAESMVVGFANAIRGYLGE